MSNNNKNITFKFNFLPYLQIRIDSNISLGINFNFLSDARILVKKSLLLESHVPHKAQTIRNFTFYFFFGCLIILLELTCSKSLNSKLYNGSFTKLKISTLRRRCHFSKQIIIVSRKSVQDNS